MKNADFELGQVFSSVIQLMDVLNTEEKCIAYVQHQRWGDTPTCTHCGCQKVYCFSDGKRFKCAACRKQFTVRMGTCFEDSNVPMRKWLVALYLVISHKKGVSSHQLAKDIAVTQKTAWFMLHRIRHRLGFEDVPVEAMDGVVEADETFVGGKNKNRHWDKKVPQSQGRSFKDKTPVLGLLQQNVYGEGVNKRTGEVKRVLVEPSRVRCFVLPDTKAASIMPVVRSQVVSGATLISDEWHGYRNAGMMYNHQVVDHGRGQYQNKEGYSSNGIESFWSQLKRGLIGVYHAVSRKHLHRYCAEFALRHNTRSMKDGARLAHVLTVSDSSLKYKTLIGKA